MGFQEYFIKNIKPPLGGQPTYIQNYKKENLNMCFGGIKMRSPTVLPIYKSVVRGFQRQFGTRPEDDGNYHYWCRDNDGNIIDPTPLPQGPHPERIVDEPIYLPWSQEKHIENTERVLKICPSLKLPSLQKQIALEDYYQNPKPLRCFMNAMALNHKKGYEIVCGSFGWVIGHTPKGEQVIAVDFGY